MFFQYVAWESESRCVFITCSQDDAQSTGPMCLIESVCVKESKSVLESSSKDLVCLHDVSSVIHTVTLLLTRRMTLMGVHPSQCQKAGQDVH